jgi:hypothetical protein
VGTLDKQYEQQKKNMFCDQFCCLKNDSIGSFFVRREDFPGLLPLERFRAGGGGEERRRAAPEDPPKSLCYNLFLLKSFKKLCKTLTFF